MNEEEAFGEETEDSGHVVSGEISIVVSMVEYRCCRLCCSKVEMHKR